MKINNLKYSIWQFIFFLIFTVPTLIGTIICFKENDLLFAIIYLLLFIIGLTSLVNSFKVTGHGYITKITPTKEIKEILIEQYKYCDLNYCDKLIKVFYSKDSQNRILFIMMENNTVVVRKQRFIIYPDDRTKTPIWIGQWITRSGRDSFYADIQIAIREYQIE